MSWTDERVEALKTMWAEGKSASQIAKALGGVTRNAVIGKVHRLGLSNRAAAKPAAEPARERPEPKAERAPKAAPKAKPAEAEAPAAQPAPAPQPAPEPAAARPAPQPEPEPEPRPASAPAAQPEAPVVARRGGPGAGPQPPAPSEVSEEARRRLEEVEKKARRLSLLELTERTCKWPIGDPATDDFYFCGLPAHGGKPYCEDHVVIAYQPMSPRRDRSRSR
ncbi:GcrA family cell cycle regulator [Oceanicella actignis]|uniref:GcrA family cell cycle regulator n=1 Tax=Oceanicella actignis TaxID=1189325 RepID=UPI0011E615E5|nr:GcrA family cell cycle regulator [Oceanicella actignis]TYO91210.1 GcrA cell cycle regulator [Oceanicella actignis]